MLIDLPSLIFASLFGIAMGVAYFALLFVSTQIMMKTKGRSAYPILLAAGRLGLFIACLLILLPSRTPSLAILAWLMGFVLARMALIFLINLDNDHGRSTA